MNVDKILMPTDFSDCANAALGHAIFLAQQLDAEIHLLHVVLVHAEDPHAVGHEFPATDEIFSRLDEIAQSELQRTLGMPPDGALTIHKAQRRAIAAAPAIVQYAADEGIDLIVLGTHGRRGLRRFLLGSVTEEVVRTAACPVLTVHDDEESQRMQRIDRIVVPFDFSHDSQAALETAKVLAKIYGSSIDLVHVVAPPMAPGVGAPVPAPYHVDLSDEVEKALDRHLTQSASDDIAIETHVLYGHAPSQITDYAEQSGANLIVIGSHGLTGMSRFLLGSVSERVVRGAHCPVLVLRHEEPETATDSS